MFYFFVDLLVHNSITIAVEVKSFIGGSTVNAFKEALGQYLLYRAAFAELGLEQPLYLAIPHATYESFFQLPVIQRLVRVHEIACVTYNVEREELVEWIHR